MALGGVFAQWPLKVCVGIQCPPLTQQQLHPPLTQQQLDLEDPEGTRRAEEREGEGEGVVDSRSKSSQL